jgi:hypothetical protein
LIQRKARLGDGWHYAVMMAVTFIAIIIALMLGIVLRSEAHAMIRQSGEHRGWR